MKLELASQKKATIINNMNSDCLDSDFDEDFISPLNAE